MNYYKVTAKCGHVGGKKKFILIDFYIIAESGKAAAKEVRYKGRVKHDQKDAIREVCEVSLDEYIAGLEAYRSDPYTKVHNVQEQQRFWDLIEPRVMYEAEYQDDEDWGDEYCDDMQLNARRSRRYGYNHKGKFNGKYTCDYEKCA